MSFFIKIILFLTLNKLRYYDKLKPRTCSATLPVWLEFLLVSRNASRQKSPAHARYNCTATSFSLSIHGIFSYLL